MDTVTVCPVTGVVMSCPATAFELTIVAVSPVPPTRTDCVGLTKPLPLEGNPIWTQNASAGSSVSREVIRLVMASAG